MADPKHPEHKEMLEWYGRTYDPTDFDPMEVRERFRIRHYGVDDIF
jgi:hypothetical protein